MRQARGWFRDKEKNRKMDRKDGKIELMQREPKIAQNSWELRNVYKIFLALCGVLVATISITPANLILDKEGSKSSLQFQRIKSTKEGKLEGRKTAYRDGLL